MQNYRLNINLPNSDSPTNCQMMVNRRPKAE
jgi:hypothetical protein